MNSELQSIWNRWLEGREIEPGEATRLIEALEQGDGIAERLLADLDVHRQLTALARADTDDVTFVRRMTDRYQEWHRQKNHVPTTADSPGQFDWLDQACNDTPASAPVASATRDQPNPVHLSVAPREYRPARKVHPSRLAGLAICLTVLAGLTGLVLWMNSGLPGGSEQADVAESPSQGTGEDAAQPSAAQADSPNSGSVSEPEDRSDAGENPLPEIPLANQPPSPTKRENPLWQSRELTPSRQPDNSFAAIQELQPCVWVVGPQQPDRVGRETLDLRSGIARIEFDDGGSFTITGPSRLTLAGPHQIDVASGTMSGQVADANGEAMVIRSPDSRFLPRGQSRFDLQVLPAGVSELNVDQGAIDVQPWHARVSDVSILLSGDGLNRARIDGSGDDSPARAQFQNTRGEYEGWVNVNGQLLKSGDPEFVENVFQKAELRFREAPDQLQREWNNLTSMMRSNNVPVPDQLPGIQPPGEMDDFLKRMRDMMQSSARSAAVPGEFGGAEAFEAVLNVNGQQLRFTSREEFDAARKNLLGSFADVFAPSNK